MRRRTGVGGGLDEVRCGSGFQGLFGDIPIRLEWCAAGATVTHNPHPPLHTPRYLHYMSKTLELQNET